MRNNQSEQNKRRPLKKKDAFTTLWAVAAVVSFFLLPLGLPLLIVCAARELTTMRRKNEVPLRFGLLSIAISLWMILFIGMASADADGIGKEGFMMLAPVYLQGIGFGLIASVLAGALNARDRRIDRCLYLIKTEHITALSLLADGSGLTEKQVVRALRTAIRLDELRDAQVDERLDEVIFEKSCWARQRAVCSSCGAELVVNFGQTLVCEYCGSALRPENRRRGA